MWFRSGDKYRPRRPTSIFTVISSPPKPLEEFRQNRAYEFLSVSRCVRPKPIPVCQQIWPNGFKIAICPLLDTVTISLLHLHWSAFFETCLRCYPSGLVAHARKWFRSVNKYGRRQPCLIFTVVVSPPKPLEEFCRNLSYEFLSMPRCVRPKMIVVRLQI